MDFELVSYDRLVESNVATPKLIGVNRDDYILVKEYIDGPVMIDWVAEEKLTDELFLQMFQMQHALKKKGYHVDYYPANFILSQGQIYCIDYEAHPYLEEWDFTNWGIFYWLNNDGIRQFLEEERAELINKPGTYKPYEEGFIQQRDRLVKLYEASLNK